MYIFFTQRSIYNALKITFLLKEWMDRCLTILLRVKLADIPEVTIDSNQNMILKHFLCSKEII